MSDVIIYHPGLQRQESVHEEALFQLRRSGWLLLSEHEANEAQRAEREAAASKPAAKKGDQ